MSCGRTAVRRGAVPAPAAAVLVSASSGVLSRCSRGLPGKQRTPGLRVRGDCATEAFTYRYQAVGECIVLMCAGITPRGGDLQVWGGGQGAGVFQQPSSGVPAPASPESTDGYCLHGLADMHDRLLSSLCASDMQHWSAGHAMQTVGGAL